MRIPLFPLHVVLFPGMALPLHIFEPRYQLMIRRCLEGDRTFGVCLIQSGEEVGAPAVPCTVGTTCEILTAEPLAEGRMNLSTVGRQRFRVLRVHHSEPYLEADIEPLPDESGPEAERLAPQVQEAAIAYIRTLLAAGGEENPQFRLPDDPVALSHLVGAVLQVSPAVRQELLAEDCVVSRLHRELKLLEEETEKLPALRDSEPNVARPFSVDPRRLSPN